MTGTNGYHVTLIDSEAEILQADYYQFESGWVTFKEANGKAIASYPEASLTRIRAAIVDVANLTMAINASSLITAEDLSQHQRDVFLRGAL